MRRSLFTLRALATLTLSAATALPQHADKGILAEQTFSCSGEQTLSLCCTGRISSNGAAQDCEESVHFMIGPTRLSPNDYSRQLHSSTVNQCSSEQLGKGFKRPVCCKAGFKPAVSTLMLPRPRLLFLTSKTGRRSRVPWHELHRRRGGRRLEVELPT